MKGQIREPKQERSIEKKNRIIEAGYELFSEIGYYGTNTQEIAKRANVSTGIVYGYFKDKHDILLCVLDIYIKKVCEPLMALVMNDMNSPADLNKVVYKIIDKTIDIHEKNAQLHNTLHSLAPNDESVDAQFLWLENHVSQNLSDRFKEINLCTEHAVEKVHLAMNLVQSFAHEYVFDKHDYIDYAAMRILVANTIINMFN